MIWYAKYFQKIRTIQKTRDKVFEKKFDDKS